MYHRKPEKNCACEVINPELSKVCYIIQSLKKIINPHMISIYCANFLGLLRCCVNFWSADNESKSVFK